jgi:hypothetical protein
MNMNLNGAIGYDWNMTIEKIQKDFTDKQYSEIEIENDFISAKYDYNGLFSDYYFLFSNEKMYRGGISYLGFPDEQDVSDDDYTIDDIDNIQKKILKLLTKKYGEPQEVKEDKKEFEGEIRYYKWYFKNNCTLEFSMRIEYFILTACYIDVRFTNNNIEFVKEKPVINTEILYGDYKYKNNENGTITITKYEGSGDVIIPTEIEGKSVTAIGNKAFNYNQLNNYNIAIVS